MLRWLAAVSINLGKDVIEPYLEDVLSPVHREFELASTYKGKHCFTNISGAPCIKEILTSWLLLKAGLHGHWSQRNHSSYFAVPFPNPLFAVMCLKVECTGPYVTFWPVHFLL